MDAERFDQLARSLSAAGSRRGILALLTGLPLGGVLSLLLDAEPSDAKRRKKGNQQEKKGRSQDKRRVGGENHKHEHRRRKHKNKRRNGHKNKHKDKHSQECQPQSLAQTCEDRCGQVQNNCQQEVDCGSCECQPACAACQRCDETTTSCQADPAQVGDACGDGLVCQEDGDCDCQGNSCGGCRACADGRCVVDTTVVCTAQDQCHEAGECDPETGACTTPRKDDGAPCDDIDPCTTDDTCQNGTCTGGPARDCSSEADVCNTGVCRASDGACVKQPKGNGTFCGAGRQCQGGVCEAIACLAVNAVCDPQDDLCCDTACTAGAACAGAGQARCCRGDGDDCVGNCDCCDGVCANGVCCQPNRQCNGSSDCCEGFACINNVCVTPCGTQHAVCGEFPCCDGFRCVDGECWPDTCLAPVEVCTSSNWCCPDGTMDCRTTVSSEGRTLCCRPYDETCRETSECCDNSVCGPQGKCCRGGFFDPDRGGEQARGCFGHESECCPGRRCNPFSDICCLEEGQPVAADKVVDCCHFTRENGVCSCHSNGEACSAPFGPSGVSSCCDGLICFDGACEPPCLFPGGSCGAGSLPCCGGSTCQQGFCL